MYHQNNKTIRVPVNSSGSHIDFDGDPSTRRVNFSGYAGQRQRCSMQGPELYLTRCLQVSDWEMDITLLVSQEKCEVMLAKYAAAEKQKQYWSNGFTSDKNSAAHLYESLLVVWWSGGRSSIPSRAVGCCLLRRRGMVAKLYRTNFSVSGCVGTSGDVEYLVWNGIPVAGP